MLINILFLSMSGSKNLTSFAYWIFHCRRPPGLKLGHITKPLQIKNLTAFSAREVKRVTAKEREKEEYSFAKKQ